MGYTVEQDAGHPSPPIDAAVRGWRAEQGHRQRGENVRSEEEQCREREEQGILPLSLPAIRGRESRDIE